MAFVTGNTQVFMFIYTQTLQKYLLPNPANLPAPDNLRHKLLL